MNILDYDLNKKTEWEIIIQCFENSNTLVIQIQIQISLLAYIARTKYIIIRQVRPLHVTVLQSFSENNVLYLCWDW